MKKLFSFVLLALALSGCSSLRVHKMEIEQGNIITPAETKQLRVGMSAEQVKEVMGSPMLSNIFSSNALDYVYTYKAAYGEQTTKRLICGFKGGRLQTMVIAD